jgi:LmbE family N-acetylglucosaminyl deacetylase
VVEVLTVLCVASHPDDEVLGCGGTLARHARNGEDVIIAILGEGSTSRSDQREDAGSAGVDALRAAAESAGEIIGANRVLLSGLPDNRFDSVPLLDVVKIIERLIAECVPATVYTHHPGDCNVDHSVAFRAVLAATRPQPGTCVRELLTFEVASSTEWAFGMLGGPFRPSVFVDISDTLQTKLQAMAVYGSEVRLSPHPRSIEKLDALARTRGAAIGIEAAECFELVRRIV